MAAKFLHGVDSYAESMQRPRASPTESGGGWFRNETMHPTWSPRLILVTDSPADLTKLSFKLVNPQDGSSLAQRYTKNVTDYRIAYSDRPSVIPSVDDFTQGLVYGILMVADGTDLAFVGAADPGEGKWPRALDGGYDALVHRVNRLEHALREVIEFAKSNNELATSRIKRLGELF